MIKRHNDKVAYDSFKESLEVFDNPINFNNHR